MFPSGNFPVQHSLHIDWLAFYSEGLPVVAQTLKNPLAMQEAQVRFLGQEDPLEESKAAHCSIPAWRSHGQRSLAGCSPWGPIRVGNDWAANRHTHSTLRIVSFSLPSTPAIHLSLSVRLVDYFIMMAGIRYHHCLFLCSHCPDLDVGLSSGFPAFFGFGLSFLPLSLSYSYPSLSSFFWHNKGCVPCPSPEITHCSRKPFFVTRTAFRNQNLDAWCAHWCRRDIIASGPFQ